MASTEVRQQRLSAVMAGAYRHPQLIDQQPDILGMAPSTTKESTAALSGEVPSTRRPSIDATPSVACSSRRVSQAWIRPSPISFTHARLVPGDHLGDCRRSRLELVGNVGEGRGRLEGDGLDHLATALPGRHGLEQFRTTVEGPDPGAHRPCGRKRRRNRHRAPGHRC